MKSAFSYALLSCLCLGSLSFAPRARGESPSPDASTRLSVVDSQAVALNCRQIYLDNELSRARKEKQLANLVRASVIAATVYSKPGEAVALATEIATACSRAAPSFLETIVKAAATTPSVSKSSGALEEIRAAAVAGVHRREKTPQVAAAPQEVFAAAKRPQSRATTSERFSPGVVRHVVNRTPEAASENEPQNPSPLGTESETQSSSVRQRRSRLPSDGNAAIHVTVGVATRADDNVYLSKSAKKSDVIVSLQPGITMEYGRKSNAHAEASYQHSFTHYVNKRSANVQLDNADAALSYDGTRTSFTAYAHLNQTNQNDRNVITAGVRQIYRTETLALGLSNETKFTSKTSLGSTIEFDSVRYPNGGLVGNRSIWNGEKLYYALRPKFDVYAGYRLRAVNGGKTTLTTGDSSTFDTYENLGIRGDLTPRLSVDASVGYRNARTKDHIPKNGSTPASTLTSTQGSLGFEGSLTYSVGAKSSASLNFSNDFGRSANGETIKNADIGLSFTAALSNQLTASISLNYSSVDYGNAPYYTAFATGPLVLATRRDHFYVGSTNVSYRFTDWLSTSISYTYRMNQSSISELEFGNNLLSAEANLRY